MPQDANETHFARGLGRFPSSADKNLPLDVTFEHVQILFGFELVILGITGTLWSPASMEANWQKC